MNKKVYVLESDPEGIFWKPTMTSAKPYCHEHKVPLIEEGPFLRGLKCPVGDEVFQLKFGFQEYRKYVKEVIGDPNIKDYKVVRLDTAGSTVLAKERVEIDSAYFIESKLSDTVKGLELMIQVGKKNEKGKKVQLFVDLPAERLGFDKSTKDKHPVGLFAKVTAVFKDSKTSIKAKTEK